MKTFAGAIARDGAGLRVVLSKSEGGVRVREPVTQDPSSKLVSITFDPPGLSQPIAVVSGITSEAKPFVSDIRPGELVVGGADNFHFIAIFTN